MSIISPKDISERDFTKTFLGYSPTEVDDYINRLIKNYSALYRENAELEHKLSVALMRLETIDDEEEKVKLALQTAKKAGEKIIEESYMRADDILISIKTSCDAILRGFREKIETGRTELAGLKDSILTFKNELFEKYRLHIELVEQLSPTYDYEEEHMSADDYVDRVVSALKRDVAAEYGISIDDVEKPENIKVAIKPESNDKNESSAVHNPKPTESTEETVVALKPASAPKKKVKVAAPSVMELINEYEDTSVLAGKKSSEVQLMLNLDTENENEPELISAVKK